MKKHIPANDLSSQLKTHYAAQQLTNDQLDTLLHLRKANSKKQKLTFASLAASLIIIPGLFLYTLLQQDYRMISKDIAYNHNSLLQMEVMSGELKTVQGHLNKLGFTLVNSHKIEKGNLQLLGGRYCNINGKIAAQMQLKHNKTNTTYTFYQAKLASDVIENFKTHEVIINGVKVKLWQEKGLLMGLAF